MKIIDASLSMDAVTHHKEVKRTYGNEGLSQEEQAEEKSKSGFRLNLQGFPESVLGQRKIEREPANVAGEVSASVDRFRVNNVREEVNLQKMVDNLFDVPVNLTGSMTKQPEGQRSLDDGGSFSMLFGEAQISHKEELLEFSSMGHVVTADGKTIDFSLELSLTRTETVYGVQLGAIPIFLDPLVLSFEDGLSTLSDNSFTFDLNGDGLLDDIPALANGSGFLAIDMNEDGIINDGYELFGPRTGAGYGELSLYDVDGNNWIDESDPVFDQLSVWLGAGQEDQRLVSLREAGVGALALGSTETFFDMKDKRGNILGQLKRSGLFIMENGEPKPMLEIDFSVGAENSLVGREESSSIDTLQQAMGTLHQRIRQHRRRMVWQIHNKIAFERSRPSLFDQYWSWQKTGDIEKG